MKYSESAKKKTDPEKVFKWYQMRKKFYFFVSFNTFLSCFNELSSKSKSIFEILWVDLTKIFQKLIKINFFKKIKKEKKF